MHDPSMPPERFNWKAVPLVALVFAVFGMGMAGLAYTVRTHTGFLDAPPDPIAERMETGGAVFTARAEHLPPVFRQGPYVLMATGTDPVVFGDGASCVQTARFLVSERSARDSAIVCHPLGG